MDAHGLLLQGFPDALPSSLRLMAGSTLLLSGPRGGGKSTLIRTLLGVVSPLAGHIDLFGVRIDGAAPPERLSLRRAVSMVEARDGLFPAWNGYDNLALPLRYNRMLEEGAVAEELLGLVSRYGMPMDWLERPVTQLGVEQRAVLSIFRALLARPRLLIMDDVSVWKLLAEAHIDVENLFREYWRFDCSLIHSLSEESMDTQMTTTLPTVLAALPTQRCHINDGHLAGDLFPLAIQARN